MDLERFFGRIGDDHMEGVVDHGAAFRRHMVIGEHLVELGPDVLRRERDDAGGPAQRRRAGRALERVGVEHAGGRDLLDVGVAVDAARQHELAGRVDLALTRGKPLPDRRDRLADDRHVGRERAAASGDGSAADDEVVGFVGHFPLRARRA